MTRFPPTHRDACYNTEKHTLGFLNALWQCRLDVMCKKKPLSPPPKSLCCCQCELKERRPELKTTSTFMLGIILGKVWTFLTLSEIFMFFKYQNFDFI